jgi:dimethylargininase
VVAADFAARSALQGFRLLELDPPDGYAANVLHVNGTLLLPAGFPRVRAKLGALGLPLVELDTSEIRKMDGGLTCLSIRL